MQTLEAIYQRRAVKHFDPSYKISEADEKKLFEAAQQSPSSFNIQHWRFVNIKNTDIRKQIRSLAWDQPQITEASLLLVVCADVKAWDKNPERYWEKGTAEMQANKPTMIRGFYNGNESLQHDEALRSVGFVSQTLMIAAKDMGLDSCPMIGFDIETVSKIINLPQDHIIGMIITIGKALKPAYPKGGYLPLNEIVKIDRF